MPSVRLKHISSLLVIVPPIESTKIDARRGPLAAQPCASRVLASYLPYIAIITLASAAKENKGLNESRGSRGDVPGLADEQRAPIGA